MLQFHEIFNIYHDEIKFSVFEKKFMNLPPLEESIRCPKRIANALLFGDSAPPKNKLIVYIVISRKFQYLKKKSRTCLLRQKKNP